MCRDVEVGARRALNNTFDLLSFTLRVMWCRKLPVERFFLQEGKVVY